MHRIHRMLIARGYWDAADGGEGGAAGGSGASGGGGGEGGSRGEGGDGEGGDGGDDDAGGGSDADAAALKASVASLKAEREKFKADADRRAKELTDLKTKLKGINIDEVRKILDERKTEEQRKLEEKGQWDTLRQQMVDEHTRELTEERASAAELQKRLDAANRTIENMTVGTMFSNSKFIENEITLTPSKARVIYGRHFDIVEGKVIGYDKPAGEAGRTMLVNGRGEPLGFEDALAKIIKADPDFESIARSKSKPGAGSNTNGTNKPVDADTRTLSGRDRIAAGLRARDKTKHGLV